MNPFKNLMKILTSPPTKMYTNILEKTPGSLQVPCYQWRTIGYEMLGLGTRGRRWEEGLKQHFSTMTLPANCTGHVFTMQNVSIQAQPCPLNTRNTHSLGSVDSRKRPPHISKNYHPVWELLVKRERRKQQRRLSKKDQRWDEKWIYPSANKSFSFPKCTHDVTLSLPLPLEHLN